MTKINILIFLFLFNACNTSYPKTITVDINNGGDHSDIQSALNEAVNGDEILVEPGLYVINEPLNFSGKSVALQSTATSEETIIQRADSAADGCVVLFENAEPDSAVLAGFTIENGTNSGIRCTGGAMPIIRDCRIRNNSAERGGGIVSTGNPSLINCIITGNTASDYGGGIWAFDATISNCIISNNTAQRQGGGIFLRDPFSPLIDNCLITQNRAGAGSAIACTQSTTPTIRQCLMTDNAGACILCEHGGAPDIVNSTITGNFSFSDCTVHCPVNGYPKLTNCILWGNVGAAIFANDLDEVTVQYSCIEGETPFPGDGNINVDPRFIGWGDAPVSYVASREALLQAMTGFNLSLHSDSPCLGTGKEGADMGAETTISSESSLSEKTIFLSPGIYDFQDITLRHNISIEGTSRETTIIDGGLRGLETGQSISQATITRGTRGGIVISTGESPRIIDCTIAGNAAQSNSQYGAVTCFGASVPQLIGCSIIDNLASGVSCADLAAPLIQDTLIQGNMGNGLIALEHSTPRLEDCVISENADSGVVCTDYAAPILNGCIITRNHSTHRSGGVACDDEASVTAAHCAITDNFSQSFGGGIDMEDAATALFSYCTISGNMADRAGGGASCENRSATSFLNCTIAGNYSRNGGGIAGADIADIAVTGSIIWSNTGKSIQAEESCTIAVSHTCMEGDGIFPGPGNIDQDPLFRGWESEEEVDVRDQTELLSALTGFSLSLSSNSPCIGAGPDGENMGAGPQLDGERSFSERKVLLLPGTYDFSRLPLAYNVSIRGEMQGAAIVTGTVLGLRHGQSIASVTMTNETAEGIIISGYESPDVIDCNIHGCRNDRGAGIFCANHASPVFTRCTVHDNIAEIAGGGVYCSPDAAPTFASCMIRNNSAQNGGGIYCGENASCELLHTTIAGNLAYQHSPFSSKGMRGGGGIFCDDGASLLLTGCTLTGNSAYPGDGGALFLQGAYTRINQCTLAGNMAYRPTWGGENGYGGAIRDGSMELIITNTFIAGNKSYWNGGGLSCSTNATLINCTISDNLSAFGGGSGAFSHGSIFKNCIFWGNQKDDLAWKSEEYIPTVSFSCLQHVGDLSDKSIFSLDPLFARAGSYDFAATTTRTIDDEAFLMPDFIADPGDYHLNPGSPCIHAGDNVQAPPDDFDGELRPFGNYTDVGADEWIGPSEILFMRGDANLNTMLELGDAITILSYLFDNDSPELICPMSADANDDGKIQISDPIVLLDYLFSSLDRLPEPFLKCASDITPDTLACPSFPHCE